MVERKRRSSTARGAGKDPDAFRNIGETAELLDVKNHVLRFWEGRFPQLKPMKRAGNRRLYRPEDIELLFGIKQLLHNDAYTIKGVQKILREDGVDSVKEIGRPLVPLGPASDDEDTNVKLVPTRSRRVTAKSASNSENERVAGERAPMLRDAVELAVAELEVCRSILLGEEEPVSVRRSTAGE